MTGGSDAAWKIKSSAEDFVVEEICANGTALEVGKSYAPSDIGMNEDPDGKFVTFVLQKKNWNTVQALKAVARSSHRGIKSVSFAGTKDRTSVSTQLCSLFGGTPEQVMATRIKDISINGAWRSSAKVDMGSLLGNRFTIVVRGAADANGISQKAALLNGMFPNYFGEQRFGYRENNVQIGVDIIKGDIESAVMRFLTDTTNETNAESIAARERLKDEKDFQAAMEYFPQFLKYERLMIEHLSKMPTDFGGALRRLPRQLSLMFIHAVDAHIFNMELDERIKAGQMRPRVGDYACKADGQGFPDLGTIRQLHSEDDQYPFVLANIIGYEQETNTFEDQQLEQMGITKEMFRVRAMPELNCKGNVRPLFAPFTNFSCTQFDGAARIRFSLPSGSYATVLVEGLVGHSTEQADSVY